MVSLQRQFVFVHIPKTGGNAMQNILRDYSEDQVVCLAPHHDGVERFEIHSEHGRLQKHATLAEYRDALGAAVLSKMFKFCCVRNPWDRAISFYFSPHRGRVAFDRAEFLLSLDRLRPVDDFLALDGRATFQNVDFVMRFEQLGDDFKKVCERIGIPAASLPIRNKSEHTHYSQYYDPELVEIIRQRDGRVIDHFGYKFEPAPSVAR